MLSVNVPRGTTLERINYETEGELPDRAVWLDLYSPTHAEDKLVERALGIAAVSYTHLTLPTIYSV